MGFRFYNNISLLPGVRLNLSKGGIRSLSIGGKGMSYNIGKKGIRATGGMSYLHYEKYPGEKEPEQLPEMREVIDRKTGEILQIPVHEAPAALMPSTGFGSSNTL